MVTMSQIPHSMKLSLLSWTLMLFLVLPPKVQSCPLVSEERHFIEHNYPLVMPVECHLEAPGHTMMYVPILQMIQELFKNTDILSKIREPNTEPGYYVSYHDGTHFQENELLSTEELHLAIQLYIDDLEIANPLGTSRKVHKLCAVYWVLANVPPNIDQQCTLYNWPC